MNFTPLQNLIPRAAASYGISNEFRAIAVCNAFESLLPDLFPENEDAKKQIIVKYFKNNTLTIGVPSSTWASEIMMRKHRIIDSLNTKFTDGPVKAKIKDIKTMVV